MLVKPWRNLWIMAGQAGFWVTRPAIKLVVRGSRRSRVLVTCGDEYLLLKHWLGDNSWMLPGGGLHKDEEPIDAARREIEEEIGLRLEPSQLQAKGTHTCRDGGFSFTYDLYAVHLSTHPKLRLQRLEILSATWFNRAATPPGRCSPEVAVALANWPE